MTVIIDTPPDLNSTYLLAKKFLKLDLKDEIQAFPRSVSYTSGVSINQTLSSIKQGALGRIIAEFAE